ncbi:MAG: Asp23/Gls24 family envelope stress response protein [Clostridiales bacterium]|nr:Asp23/Gls24 family envelope stress response protein [Clostridiales bacterium]
MILQNKYGSIDITSDVIAGIVSVCANNCYGVKGIVGKKNAGGITKLLRREKPNQGIKIEKLKGCVNIELHIVVRYGINIAAVGNSIISEIRYNVERMTGITVGKVDVCVDAIVTD